MLFLFIFIFFLLQAFFFFFFEIYLFLKFLKKKESDLALCIFAWLHSWHICRASVEIDSSDNLIMSKSYEAEGRFSFISHAPGEHVICLTTNSTRWYGGKTLRVHLSINIGENANDYELISKKEHLSAVETRLYQLLSQTKMILSEQVRGSLFSLVILY